ncbi:tyrosine-type recombinase/integrase [Bradyrhizobium sp. NP1]|uniref:tyrosine-type recombinase/integrase n=1 Tax=Bradyrhizobium sp. NP1 TaxID=3049772 RepID=UPI0025A666BE|nr:tyrosine-type recombinase/integrase [Bradyrhizobium sp. NP1]WJR75855.1 tyrosine-type recombinase/integrase [Bradyrhizobium sp. NP1]
MIDHHCGAGPCYKGKSNERDRRPTQNELNRLIEYAETNPQQFIPLERIIRFAVATAMRQAEICRIEWSDVDMSKRTVTIRDRKDPRRKEGNHQIVPSSIPRATTHGRSFSSNVLLRAASGACSLTTRNPLELLSVDRAMLLISTICVFTICAMKAQVASLKRVSRYSRLPW